MLAPVSIAGLLAAFQNNQKEVQSCRGKGPGVVTDPVVCLFSTIFISLEVNGRGFCCHCKPDWPFEKQTRNVVEKFTFKLTLETYV